MLNALNPGGHHSIKMVNLVIEKRLSFLEFVTLLQEFNAKLSDFGLAKAGPTGDRTHVSTQVMGTQGYAAPEYMATGPVLVFSISFFNVLFTMLMVANEYLFHCEQMKVCFHTD